MQISESYIKNMTGRGISAVKRKKAISKSQRANVLFPVGRLYRYLKQSVHKYRIGVGSAVYMASVIEYLTAEVLELAGNAARSSKKTRITPRHILFATATDKELNDLLHDVTIPAGGVVPRIHPNLIPRNKSATLSKKTAIPIKPVQRNKQLKPKKTGAPHTIAAFKNATTGNAHPKMRNKGLSLPSASPSSSGSVILSEKKLFLGQTLMVIKQDITTVIADAIIHPTNGSFAMVGEIGRALEKVGGKKLVQEVMDVHKKTGTLAPCDVALSASFNTGSKWIIHVNGPSHGDLNAYDKLETSVKNCLVLADLKNFKCIALPSIGSGKAGFPKQQAAQTILKCIYDYFVNVMTSSLKKIYFVLYDTESIAVYTSEITKLDG